MLRLAGSFPRLPPPVRPISPAPAPSQLSLRRVLLLLSSAGFSPPSCYSSPSFAAMAAAAPPVAKKVPRQLVEHGDVRVDNYYWLRDDSRSDPDVLAHLRAENDYTAAVMSDFSVVASSLLGNSSSANPGNSLGDVKQLEDEIYAEIRGRIKEDDIDAPLRKGRYYYYERTLTGKEYVQHCRRPVSTDAPITVHDVMPTGPDAPDEHIILDENVKAEGHDYYSIGAFKGGRAIDFIDPTYAVDPEESQFHSSVLRFHYSSMRTPPSVYDYDMDSGVSVLKKIHTILGGFNASNYVTERKWAAAADGTQVPMSILYRNDLVKLDGSDPMLLYGYGSYEVRSVCLFSFLLFGFRNKYNRSYCDKTVLLFSLFLWLQICIDPSFRGSRFSLVDRGFIYVIAHIRGGGEMGRKWYEDGKLLKKKNTFTDFIDCAEHLIKSKYCSREKLCINGRSAGGLLMGAVLNMRPDLFRAAVAGVPFVDVVTTMLDPTIPLTTAEWEEWGDPRKEEFYYYMKSYSPVDNASADLYL
ncbi:Prolyl oligopeptidase family protein [Zea mays]|uniref:Prolyl endopeptidase-like n=1 Tax=Zea mays TaxID=4577 RepID=A0A1D6LLT9_MAIZE|nr:Prolyl oligopeptidase family protein [Zea mays]